MAPFGAGYEDLAKPSGEDELPELLEPPLGEEPLDDDPELPAGVLEPPVHCDGVLARRPSTVHFRIERVRNR
jgi:hypothetical protein